MIVKLLYIMSLFLSPDNLQKTFNKCVFLSLILYAIATIFVV